MFQSSTASVLPVSNPELTEKSESSGYNWKTLTKAGLVFVTTMGMFLILKATKPFNLISSWFTNRKMDFGGRETKPGVREETEEIEAYSGYQKAGLELTDFEFSETSRTDNPLQQTDSKELPLPAVKNSHEHITFMPQKAKRNPMEILEKISPEFQVNTYTTSDQSYSSVAGLSDGKFVVTWQSNDQDGSGLGVYGQIFNTDSTKSSSEFQANTYTTGYQQYPSVAVLNDDKFVVTWQSNDQDGSGLGVYGQMFNADGTKFSPEFRVNTYTTNGQWDPSITGLSDGKFVVTWGCYIQDGDNYVIYGQIFNADGTKFLSEFQVNTYTSIQMHSSIVGLSNNKFVVTWQSMSQDGYGNGVYGQMFSVNETFAGSIEASSSYSSISSTLKTPSPTISASSMENTSYSLETSSLSNKLIYSSNSRRDEGLSSGEITGIIFGIITTVGLCVVGGFFAVKKMCKPNREQLPEHDVELDPTIPITFRCSLTGKMMNEPVEIAGERDCLYDREAIEQYFAREHKSPAGRSLKELVLIPNYDLRSKIDEYKETIGQPSAPQLEV